METVECQKNVMKIGKKKSKRWQKVVWQDNLNRTRCMKRRENVEEILKRCRKCQETVK